MVAIRKNLQGISLEDVIRVATDFESSCKTINRIINQPSQRYNTNGTEIFEEEWDNLILLDSCRYDYFSDICTLNGKLESRTSRGSTSVEFIRGNFQGPDQLDSIYISANSWYQKISEELGDARSDVFLFDRVHSENKRKRGEVRTWCEKVTEQALSRHEQYPNKRLIIHYMPPHFPYVDENGEILIDLKNKHNTDTYYNLFHRSSDRNEYVTKEEIRDAYESSVRYIINHITKLLKELNGLTVISADHGELLAERSRPIPIIETAHPEGVYLTQLIKVPWFKIRDGERRDIIEEEAPHETMENSKIVTSELDEHLRDLGYKV